MCTFELFSVTLLFEYFVIFSTRCIHRMNCCAIAMMFVRPFICQRRGVHCDHVSADLSLWLDTDSPMFWAPWHQSTSAYCQPSFSTST